MERVKLLTILGSGLTAIGLTLVFLPEDSADSLSVGMDWTEKGSGQVELIWEGTW